MEKINMRFYLTMPLLIGASFILSHCKEKNESPPPFDKIKTARNYYNADTSWYINNIPFFECSDKDIEQVYYYRWKLYKAHIRSVGKDKFVITEFINHVPWDRDPYCTINAASMHHIYEGRWLRDDRYMNGYINNLLLHGGNNRRYSESVSDAAYARYLVNADSVFLMKQLDSMKYIFDAWYDHYDSSKNLYYIPAMPDATEYTIASIDASGGKDGFEGGDAFRPTINSYMFANALAIAKTAELKGEFSLSREYSEKAAALKKNVSGNLWNDSLEHFTDRFKVSNKFVHYWDFIRGRELAGMIPWCFDLPLDEDKYSAAWKHLKDSLYLLGKYGLRTNEPSYEYYFKQFVFFEGKPGSQWNGPSWPYQSSQALTGMANLLNNYHQDVVNNTDYLKVLRLFTKQHFLPDGKINLVENYDPNKGGVIVHYYWSNHYLHSTYNNLIISGLCGLRPSKDDTLVVNPLIDSTIEYFMLSDVKYHGHNLTIVYDRDGTRYHRGNGLSVFVDSVKQTPVGGNKFYVGKPIVEPVTAQPENFALNISGTGFPKPSASVNTVPDTSLYQAVDGRIWYFPEIINFWSTRGSSTGKNWYALNFGQTGQRSAVELYLFADGKEFAVPDSITIEYKNGGDWLTVNTKSHLPLVANTVNTIEFEKVSAEAIKINFIHRNKQIAVTEIECN